MTSSRRGDNTGESWPRQYLLNILSSAVEHGFVWIGPISKERAVSLKMAVYRLRRRSDSTNVGIILPEYHLVTAGNWQPSQVSDALDAAAYALGAGQLGRIPFIYDALPDGSALPAITPAGSNEPIPALAAPIRAPIEPITPEVLEAGAAEVQLDESAVSDYVAKMRERAAKKAEQ